MKMRIEVKSWVLQVLCKRDGFLILVSTDSWLSGSSSYASPIILIKVSKRRPQLILFRHSVRWPLREEALCICLPNKGLGTVVTGAAACQNIVYLHVTKI